jgi:hypothetical protein
MSPVRRPRRPRQYTYQKAAANSVGFFCLIVMVAVLLALYLTNISEWVFPVH